MTKSGALDAAAAGCRALFFAAGPVQMQVSKANAEEALVRPYVVGTETTLAAATTAGVQRVIYTRWDPGIWRQQKGTWWRAPTTQFACTHTVVHILTPASRPH